MAFESYDAMAGDVLNLLIGLFIMYRELLETALHWGVKTKPMLLRWQKLVLFLTLWCNFILFFPLYNYLKQCLMAHSFEETVLAPSIQMEIVCNFLN